MSDEQKEKEVEVEAEKKPEPRSLSIEEVLGQYPIDREKARDVILMEISRTLIAIGQSLEKLSQGQIVSNKHLGDLVEFVKIVSEKV